MAVTRVIDIVIVKVIVIVIDIVIDIVTVTEVVPAPAAVRITVCGTSGSRTTRINISIRAKTRR